MLAALTPHRGHSQRHYPTTIIAALVVGPRAQDRQADARQLSGNTHWDAWETLEDGWLPRKHHDIGTAEMIT